MHNFAKVAYGPDQELPNSTSPPIHASVADGATIAADRLLPPGLATTFQLDPSQCMTNDLLTAGVVPTGLVMLPEAQTLLALTAATVKSRGLSG